MVSDNAKIEAARAVVRFALNAADNGNQAGEEAVVAMAAAGELLELVRDALNDGGMNPGWAVLARAAIAKATGADQ